VMSRVSGRLQARRVGAATQQKASPTYGAARFKQWSSPALSWSSGYAFGHVSSPGARPGCRHEWQVVQLSGNHFLGAKQQERYNLTQSSHGFPRRSLLLRPRPLVGRKRLAAHAQRASPTLQTHRIGVAPVGNTVLCRSH
jgi:hypothetical protein